MVAVNKDIWVKSGTKCDRTFPKSIIPAVEINADNIEKILRSTFCCIENDFRGDDRYINATTADMDANQGKKKPEEKTLANP